MKNHILRTKQLFFVGVAALSVIIVTGSYAFKGTGMFSVNNMSRNFAYAKYKVAFGATGSNLLAGVGAAFTTSTPDTKTDGSAGMVPVLVYHGIVDTPDRFSMTQDTFADQMHTLKKEGYESISMEEFYAFIHDHKSIPAKSFVLTFDDGRKDSFYGADPILNALNYTATMFIATGVSIPDAPQKPSTYYLDPNEIHKMVSTGRWEIGSHAIQAVGGFVDIDANGSKGNFLSNKMWITEKSRLETDIEYEARVMSEFTKSKEAIIAATGINPIMFSYPFGDYGQQTENLNAEYAQKVVGKAVQANYELAFQQIWPVDHEFSQNYYGENLYFLKRIEPSPAWKGEDLMERINAGKQKELPFTETPALVSGWKNLWGMLSPEAGILHTKASAVTNGSFAFLDGTYSWRDYLYTTTVDWQAGINVALVARYKDSNNYATCIFSDNNVRVEQRSFGHSEKFVEQKLAVTFPKQSLPLSVFVKGNSIECYIGKKLVAHADGISPILDRGGIGIKTWDESMNNADVAMTTISVVDMLTSGIDILSILPDITLTDIPVVSTSTPKPIPSPAKPVIKPVTPITLSPSTPYYVTDFTKIPAWKTVWGALSSSAAGIAIGATPTSTGGFAVLQGGSLWTDYELMVRPKSLGGSSFSLVSRYADNGDYVSCTYTNIGRGSVRLDTVIGGVSHQIGATMSLSRYAGTDWSNLPFTMQVFGDTVTCTANNEDAIHLTVPTMPASGGIGIKTWSKNNNGSQIIVKELRVTSLD